jgi:hypothetical protein
VFSEDHRDIRAETRNLEDAKENRWSVPRFKCDVLLGDS